MENIQVKKLILQLTLEKGADNPEAHKYVDLLELSSLKYFDPWDILISLNSELSSKEPVEAQSKLKGIHLNLTFLGLLQWMIYFLQIDFASLPPGSKSYYFSVFEIIKSSLYRMVEGQVEFPYYLFSQA